MRQIMIKSAQKPVSMYAYHLPNETHRYGILNIIGTAIWLTLQEPGGYDFYSRKREDCIVMICNMNTYFRRTGWSYSIWMVRSGTHRFL